MVRKKATFKPLPRNILLYVANMAFFSGSKMAVNLANKSHFLETVAICNRYTTKRRATFATVKKLKWH